MGAMRTAGSACFGLLLLTAGCANTPPYEEPSDPLEPVNRVIYRFNDVVDRAVFKPVAKGYQKITPTPVQTGVGNFFSNLWDPVVIVNDVLQGKLTQGASDTARVVFNSTFGVLGLIDVATPMGHPKHDEDFGQTFAVWGAGEGWYLVLPILGPSTVRDAVGLVPEYALDPVTRLTRHDEIRARNSLYVLRITDKRARLLGASKIRDTAALDEYLFTRAAYRQYRWSLIYDGNPPQMPMNGDGEDESPYAKP
jgi:phospholipid-binding lipoprotein MlaA